MRRGSYVVRSQKPKLRSCARGPGAEEHRHPTQKGSARDPGGARGPARPGISREGRKEVAEHIASVVSAAAVAAHDAAGRPPATGSTARLLALERPHASTTGPPRCVSETALSADAPAAAAPAADAQSAGAASGAESDVAFCSPSVSGGGIYHLRRRPADGCRDGCGTARRSRAETGATVRGCGTAR